MPLTCLDAQTALVLIDLQHGMSALLNPEKLAAPLARAAELAAAFRARSLPVVLVRTDFSPDMADAPRNRTESSRPTGHPPANWRDLLPELDRQTTDIVVAKHQPGAFYGTDLDLQLRRRAVTGIVLGGVATSLGIESTGRAAYDHGYNITFATDAMTDFNGQAHDHSTTMIFPLLGQVDTTQAIITELDSTPTTHR
jgi:nicotinamidase-related amidase